MIKLKKLVSCAVMAAAVSLGASAVQAMSVAIPSEGIGSWTAGSGSLIDFGVSDFELTLNLGSPTGLTFLAEDCCIAGDQFGLILDHGTSFTPWTGTDFGGTFFGTGLFRGFFTGVLDAGTHTFSLALTESCCQDGTLGNLRWEFAAAAPVPEPEIYAMLAAGLGMLGFLKRRRKGQGAAAA